MRIPWQMLYSQVLVWKALGGARYTCGGCRGCQAAPCTLHIGCCNFRLGIDLLVGFIHLPFNTIRFLISFFAYSHLIEVSL
jgi:hypothetical protein